jgi:hypothetical protein
MMTTKRYEVLVGSNVVGIFVFQSAAQDKARALGGYVKVVFS